RTTCASSAVPIFDPMLVFWRQLLRLRGAPVRHSGPSEWSPALLAWCRMFTKMNCSPAACGCRLLQQLPTAGREMATRQNLSAVPVCL
uniref:Secreted protein n=1 Tax=Macrostomum lignano TaxID=282301 RepID=A0A1I8FIQ7_9PLAT